MNLLLLSLTFSILAGQLIKLPLFSGGISLLDFFVTVFTIYGVFKLRSKLKKPPKVIIAGLLFIFVCILSEILTPLSLNAQEYLNSIFYILRFSIYILFAWLIYLNIFNLKNKINTSIIYSGVGLSVIGLLQFIFFPDLGFISKFGWDPHYFRTVSTFLDPNFAGAFFVLTLILLLSLRASLPRVLAMTIVYLALLTTFSRSSYLMFLISGLTLSFLEKSKILLLKTLMLFLILIFSFQIYTQFVSKPRNIDRAQSASFRLTTWEQGWQLFQKHPILGVGFNSYKFALEKYGSADSQFINSHGSTSNDFSLLFVLSTTGIIGLISYIYFLFSIIKYSENKVFTISSIVGLLIHSIFANSLFFPPILLLILITCVTPKK